MSIDSLKREIAELEAALHAKQKRLADVRYAIQRGDEEATPTADVFPATTTTQGRSVVKGWNPERLRMARESRRMTRADLARLCAANGVKGLNSFRLRLYEATAEEEAKAAPTIEEAALLSQITHYPAGFFVQPIDAHVASFSEQLREAMHRTIIICDVCEAETGDDDSRAHHKCAACKLDLCHMHAYAYEPTVTLPHDGSTRTVVAAHYCPKCYRRHVSHGARRGANARKVGALGPRSASATALPELTPDIGGLWSGKTGEAQ